MIDKNYVETLHIANDEEKIWVECSILWRFLSCSDEIDEIFCGSANQPLLRNKDRSCEHGEGLHPRSARLGTLLNRQEYNARAPAYSFLSLSVEKASS